MTVRTFPMPVWPNKGKGWCRWCGESVQKPALTWHKACLTQYQLHTMPPVQIAFVRDRDGPTCWDCKGAREKWSRGGDTFRYPGDGTHVGHYCPIRLVSALELEHDTPLWKTTHLPPEDRRRYFGPENLRLRCPVCHKAKTAKECADRAKVKRLEAKAPGQPRKPSRLQSRPVQAGGPSRWTKRVFTPKR